MKTSVKRYKGILTALMYVAVYYIASFLIEIIYLLSQSGGGLSLSEIEAKVANNSYALGVIASVISVWIYLLIGRIRKKPLRKTICNQKTAPIVTVMVLCLAFGARLCVTAYYYFSQSFELLKKSIDNAAAITPNLTSATDLIIALFASVIIAPFFEEMLFRGLVLGELKRVMRPWAAVALQAIVFGAAHAVLFQSLFAFVMGILLGVVYCKTRSIKAAFVCHSAFNLSVIFTGSALTGASAVLILFFGMLLVSSSLAYIIFSGEK